jgi:hypothetical protein
MQNFQLQMVKYDDFVPIYTDGSKTEEGVGCSVAVWYKKMKRRFPAQTLVYSAKATAIYNAGKEELIDWEKHLILTDSLSTILAIQNIIKQLHDVGENLRLKWISGHSGIRRNEEANQEAKAAKNTLSQLSVLDIEVLVIANLCLNRATCPEHANTYTEYTTARLTTGLTDGYKNRDEPETLRFILLLREIGLIFKF